MPEPTKKEYRVAFARMLADIIDEPKELVPCYRCNKVSAGAVVGNYGCDCDLSAYNFVCWHGTNLEKENNNHNVMKWLWNLHQVDRYLFWCQRSRKSVDLSKIKDCAALCLWCHRHTSAHSPNCIHCGSTNIRRFSNNIAEYILLHPDDCIEKYSTPYKQGTPQEKQDRIAYIENMAQENREVHLLGCAVCGNRPERASILVEGDTKEIYSCYGHKPDAIMFRRWYGGKSLYNNKKEISPKERAINAAELRLLWNFLQIGVRKQKGTLTEATKKYIVVCQCGSYEMPWETKCTSCGADLKEHGLWGERVRNKSKNDLPENKPIPQEKPMEYTQEKKIEIAKKLADKGIIPDRVNVCKCSGDPMVGRPSIWCPTCERLDDVNDIENTYGDIKLSGREEYHDKYVFDILGSALFKRSENKDLIAQIWLWNNYVYPFSNEKWSRLEKEAEKASMEISAEIPATQADKIELIDKLVEKGFEPKHIEPCSNCGEAPMYSQNSIYCSNCFSLAYHANKISVYGEKLLKEYHEYMLCDPAKSIFCSRKVSYIPPSNKILCKMILLWNDYCKPLTSAEWQAFAYLTGEKYDTENKPNIEDLTQKPVVEDNQNQKEKNNMSNTTLRDSNTTKITNPNAPMMDILKQNLELAQERVVHGAQVATADEARELLMEQVKNLLGDAFPEGFYNTPIGKCVLDLAGCFLVQSAASMYPTFPGADLVQHGSLLAMEAVSRDGVQPLIHTGKELLSGLATKFADRGIALCKGDEPEAADGE